MRDSIPVLSLSPDRLVAVTGNQLAILHVASVELSARFGTRSGEHEKSTSPALAANLATTDHRANPVKAGAARPVGVDPTFNLDDLAELAREWGELGE